MIMKWLSKKEVMEQTGVSRRDLDAAIKTGKLKFQVFNKRQKFTEADVELWQRNTVSLSDYISAEKSITHIYRSCPKQAQEYSLEKQLEEQQKRKLSIIASRELQKLKSKNQPEV